VPWFLGHTALYIISKKKYALENMERWKFSPSRHKDVEGQKTQISQMPASVVGI